MRLLLTGAFNYNEEHLKKIRSLGYNITFVQDERVQLDIDVSKFEAVVCNALFQYNDITKFKNLRFIQLTSAGMDRVPLDYVNEKGIKIANARGVYSIPMAEWVVLKILEIYKKSREFYKAQAERKRKKQRDLLELNGKTASIIGFGSVGQAVAKRLSAFEVHVIAVDVEKLESDLCDEAYAIDDLDIVLAKSDIVILSIPLTQETRHIIDAGRISCMREQSVLVNVSRGEIIDESALLEAVKHQKFLGIALDVFEEEPLSSNNPLWSLDRVIITPHNSYISDRVKDRLFNLLIANLSDVIKQFGG